MNVATFNHNSTVGQIVDYLRGTLWKGRESTETQQASATLAKKLGAFLSSPDGRNTTLDTATIDRMAEEYLVQSKSYESGLSLKLISSNAPTPTPIPENFVESWISKSGAGGQGRAAAPAPNSRSSSPPPARNTEPAKQPPPQATNPASNGAGQGQSGTQQGESRLTNSTIKVGNGQQPQDAKSSAPSQNGTGNAVPPQGSWVARKFDFSTQAVKDNFTQGHKGVIALRAGGVVAGLGASFYFGHKAAKGTKVDTRTGQTTPMSFVQRTGNAVLAVAGLVGAVASATAKGRLI